MQADPFTYLNAPARPWGLAATLGLSAVVWYTMELLQAAMGLSMDSVLQATGWVDASENTQALNFAIITCITTVLCGALVFAVAALRDGLEPRAYLALEPVPGKQVLHWLLVTAIVVVQADFALYLVKGELLPQQWVEIYRTVQSPLLFWFALVVATPIFEELLFRGFVFEGIRASPLGGLGAVTLTALAWTMVHHEQDPFEFSIILIIGLMLGIARLRTGSVLVTMAMHMLHNLISTGEIVWLAAMAE
jgi:membrane protease YdiL (CAAX protease family)